MFLWFHCITVADLGTDFTAPASFIIPPCNFFDCDGTTLVPTIQLMGIPDGLLECNELIEVAVNISSEILTDAGFSQLQEPTPLVLTLMDDNGKEYSGK